LEVLDKVSFPTRYSLLATDEHFIQTAFFKKSVYALKKHFHPALLPHFTLKFIFPGGQHSVSPAKFSVDPPFRDNTPVSEIPSQQHYLRHLKRAK